MLFTLILFCNNCSFWLLVDTYRVLRLFSKLDWLFCDSVMMIWWVFLSSVAFCSKAYLKQILKRWIELLSYCQVKLPFEKLLHALRNFPEEATDPDVLLPMAFTFKVINLLCKSYSLWLVFFLCKLLHFFLWISPSWKKLKVVMCHFLKLFSICCFLLCYNDLSRLYCNRSIEHISMVKMTWILFSIKWFF